MSLFESAISRLLIGFLGEYVKETSFDKKNIHSGLWKGHIRLDDVELKPEALDTFQLPISLVRGYIKRIELRFSPSSLLGSEPLVVKIENLFIVAATKLQFSDDEISLRKEIAKQAILNTNDIVREQVMSLKSGNNNSVYQGFFGTFAYLRAKILENIEIQVQDVHIRLEDRISNPSIPFCFGMTLNRVRVASTNSEWIPELVEVNTTSYRLIQMEQFSIYLNLSVQMYNKQKVPIDIANCPAEVFMDALRYLLPNRHNNVSILSHSFLLAPVDGKVCITICKDVKNTAVPRFSAIIIIDDLAIGMNDDQLHNITSMVKTIDAYNVRMLHSEANYKSDIDNEDWELRHKVFIIRTLRQNIRKRKWKKRYMTLWKRFLVGEMKLNLYSSNRVEIIANRNVDSSQKKGAWECYVCGHFRKSDCNLESDANCKICGRLRGTRFTWIAKGKLNPAEEKELEKLRRDMPIELLLESRTSVDEQLKIATARAEINRALKEGVDSSSYMSSLFGYKSVTTWGRLSVNDRVAIHRIVEEAMGSYDVLMPADSQSFKFEIASGSLALRSKSFKKLKMEKEDFIRAEFRNLSIGWNVRKDGSAIATSLESIVIYDNTTSNSKFKKIFSPKVTIEEEWKGKTEKAIKPSLDANETSFFYALVDFKETGNQKEVFVKLRMKDAEIVFAPICFSCVSSFFADPGAAELINELEVATMIGVEKLKTEAKIAFVDKRHYKIDMDVHAQAPVLYIPEDVTEPSSSLLIIDFGQLSFRNISRPDLDLSINLKPKVQSSKVSNLLHDQPTKEMDEKLYDEFIFKISSIQVLLSKVNEEWRDREIQESKKLHILHRFDVDVKVFSSSIPEDPELYRGRINGSISSLDLTVSSHQYNSLMHIFSCISFAVNSMQSHNQSFEVRVKKSMQIKKSFNKDQHKNGLQSSWILLANDNISPKSLISPISPDDDQSVSSYNTVDDDDETLFRKNSSLGENESNLDRFYETASSMEDSDDSEDDEVNQLGLTTEFSDRLARDGTEKISEFQLLLHAIKENITNGMKLPLNIELKFDELQTLRKMISSRRKVINSKLITLIQKKSLSDSSPVAPSFHDDLNHASLSRASLELKNVYDAINEIIKGTQEWILENNLSVTFPHLSDAHVLSPTLLNTSKESEKSSSRTNRKTNLPIDRALFHLELQVGSIKLKLSKTKYEERKPMIVDDNRDIVYFVIDQLYMEASVKSQSSELGLIVKQLEIQDLTLPENENFRYLLRGGDRDENSISLSELFRFTYTMSNIKANNPETVNFHIGKLESYFNQETIATVIEILSTDEIHPKKDFLQKRKMKDRLSSTGKGLALLKEESSHSDISYTKHHSMQDVHDQVDKIKSSLSKSLNVSISLESFKVTVHDENTCLSCFNLLGAGASFVFSENMTVIKVEGKLHNIQIIDLTTNLEIFGLKKSSSDEFVNLLELSVDEAEINSKPQSARRRSFFSSIGSGKEFEMNDIQKRLAFGSFMGSQDFEKMYSSTAENETLYSLLTMHLANTNLVMNGVFFHKLISHFVNGPLLPIISKLINSNNKYSGVSSLNSPICNPEDTLLLDIIINKSTIIIPSLGNKKNESIYISSGDISISNELKFDGKDYSERLLLLASGVSISSSIGTDTDILENVNIEVDIESNFMKNNTTANCKVSPIIFNLNELHFPIFSHVVVSNILFLLDAIDLMSSPLPSTSLYTYSSLQQNTNYAQIPSLTVKSLIIYVEISMISLLFLTNEQEEENFSLPLISFHAKEFIFRLNENRTEDETYCIEFNLKELSCEDMRPASASVFKTLISPNALHKNIATASKRINSAINVQYFSSSLNGIEIDVSILSPRWILAADALIEISRFLTRMSEAVNQIKDELYVIKPPVAVPQRVPVVALRRASETSFVIKGKKINAINQSPMINGSPMKSPLTPRRTSFTEVLSPALSATRAVDLALESPINLNIDFEEIEIWFLEDSSREDSQAIVSKFYLLGNFKWNNVGKKKLEALFEIQNCELFLSTPHPLYFIENKSMKERVSIMEPCNLNYNHIARISNEDNSAELMNHDVSAQLGKMKVRLSYKELCSAINIMQGLQPLISSLATKKSEGEGQYLRNINMGASVTGTTIPVEDMNKLLKGVVKIEANEIQIMLINDNSAHYVPVAKMDCSINARLESSFKSFEGNVKLTLSGEYHNHELVIWEPLVEPWPCEIKISLPIVLDSKSENIQLDVKIESSQELYVNITEGFIESMVGAQMAWYASLGNDVAYKARSENFSLYWIRNDSGIPLTYIDSNGFKHTLKNGQQDSIKASISSESFENEYLSPVINGSGARKISNFGTPSTLPPRGTRSRVQSIREESVSTPFKNTNANITGNNDKKLHQCVDIKLQIEETENYWRSRKSKNQKLEWKSIVNLNIDKLGSRAHDLKPTLEGEYIFASNNQINSPRSSKFSNFDKNSGKASVLCEVTAMNGSKLLRIRSPLLLSNETSSALRITICLENDVIVFDTILDPNKEFPIPVHLAHMLNFDPYSNSNSSKAVSVKVKPLKRSSVVSPTSNSTNSGFEEIDIQIKSMIEVLLSNSSLGNSKPYNFHNSKKTDLFNCIVTVAPSRNRHCNDMLNIVNVISFRAPLSISNMMSCPIDIQLFLLPTTNVPSKTTAGSCSIEAGDSFKWHGTDWQRNCDLSIKICMENFEFSSDLVLIPNNQSYLVKMKEIGSENTLSICVEVKEDLLTKYVRSVVIYAPYIMINHTDMPILIRHDTERFATGGQKVAKEMFDKDAQSRKLKKGQSKNISKAKSAPMTAFSAQDVCLGFLDILPSNLASVSTPPLHLGFSDTEKREGRARVQLPGTSWSESFVLDTAPTNTFIELRDELNLSIGPRRQILLGVSITNAPGTVPRTKLITIMPRFVLVNLCGRPLHYKQRGVNMPSEPTCLQINGRSPVYWEDGNKPQQLCVKFDEYGSIWSGGFDLKELGQFELRLRNSINKAIYLLRVEKRLEDGNPTILVLFRCETIDLPTYRIENHSLETISFNQYGENISEVLLPYGSISYTWDEPLGTKEICVHIVDNVDDGKEKNLLVGSYSLNEIFDPRQEFINNYDSTKRGLCISVHANGPTRVLRITDCHASQISGLATTSGSQKEIFISVSFDLPHIGFSLIDKTPKELIYASIQGVNGKILHREGTQATVLNITEIQIDNQLYDTPYPVMIRGLKLLKNENKNEKSPEPFLNLRLIMNEKDQHPRITFINLLTVNLAPAIEVNIDVSTLSSVLQLIDRTSKLGQTFQNVDQRYELLNIVKKPFQWNSSNNLVISSSNIFTIMDLSESGSNDYEDEVNSNVESSLISNKLQSNAYNAESQQIYLRDLQVSVMKAFISVRTSFNNLNNDESRILFGSMISNLAIDNVFFELDALPINNKLFLSSTLSELALNHYKKSALSHLYKIWNLNSVGFVQGFKSGMTDLSSEKYEGNEKSWGWNLFAYFKRKLKSGVYYILGSVGVFMINTLTSVARVFHYLLQKPTESLKGITGNKFNYALLQNAEEKLLLKRARAPRFFKVDNSALKAYDKEESRGEEILALVEKGKFRSETFSSDFNLGKMKLIFTLSSLIYIRNDNMHLEWSVRLSLLSSLKLDKEKLDIFHFSEESVTNISLRKKTILFNNNDIEKNTIYELLTELINNSPYNRKIVFLRDTESENKTIIYDLFNFGYSRYDYILKHLNDNSTPLNSLSPLRIQSSPKGGKDIRLSLQSPNRNKVLPVSTLFTSPQKKSPFSLERNPALVTDSPNPE